MIYQTLKVAIVAAAFAVCGNATAQDMVGCSGCGAVAAGATTTAPDTCGRGITQSKAASLWAGYCTEKCGYTGGDKCRSRCLGRRGNRGNACSTDCATECSTDCGTDGGHGSRRGKLRGMFGGNGCGCGGCDTGCFGYPTGGCGCDSGCDSDCCGEASGFLSGGLHHGCFSGLRGKFGNRGGCGDECEMACEDPCNDGCDDGCKFGGKLKAMFSGRSGCGSRMKGLFHRSRNQCGCAGAYFGESVGYTYGNDGIQSCVSGCATSATADSVMPVSETGGAAPMVDQAPGAIAPAAPDAANANGASQAVESLTDGAGN